MRLRYLGALGAAVLSAGLVTSVPAHAVDDWTIGDQTITLEFSDAGVGGLFSLDFDKAYETTTAAGRDVYIYAPVGWQDSADATADNPVAGITQGWDPLPADGNEPCVDGDEHVITEAQIDELGDSLESIIEIDEAHYGAIGTDAPFVQLVYNVPDDSFYDCEFPSFTAGYFAPDLLDTYGINVVTIDSFQWSQRLDNYKGTIAHEVEHLLMNYSDPGELSWVDEGLADFAIFLNGYGTNTGHTYYHQVFHRETSLTKWGGGLQDYGASYTFFQYLWEQAGGNGDGTFEPDTVYSGAGGDLLIKMIFEEQANGVEGVQAAIDDFNAATGASVPDFNEVFANWAVAIDVDAEDSELFDVKAIDMQTELGGLTIDWGNETYYDGRGQYIGNMNPQKWERKGNVPEQVALPYGVSYETFRNPGPNFTVDFDGEDNSQIAAYEGETHWWGGYQSQTEAVLDVGYAGGSTLSFASWYFIEEGWDFGYVEAMVDGEWQTLEVTSNGEVITTNDDPHGNNTEGNGITGTSGGAYFVDEPVYLEAQAALPAGTTDVRFRYSTDAAYLDTGFFVDAVSVDGAPVALSSSDWIETNGSQNNHWLVQLVAECDITPGETGENETIDGGVHVYRYAANEFSATGFDTKCLSKDVKLTAVISNQPDGDLSVFDAPYEFTLTGTGKGNN